MRRTLIFQSRSHGPISALAAILVMACQAPAADVAGWRPLTGAEVRALTKARRLENPEQPPPVTEIRGDFNGDGQGDRVVLLLNESQQQFAPYVFDGAGAPPVELARGDSRDRMFRYSLSSLPPSAREGFCQEGALDSRACERDDNSARGDVILFYEVDHGGSLFLWNGASYAEHPLRSDR